MQRLTLGRTIFLALLGEGRLPREATHMTSLGMYSKNAIFQKELTLRYHYPARVAGRTDADERDTTASLGLSSNLVGAVVASV